jgi:hypothetical protein
VAALLFKIDYAWQHGLTQGCKTSCTYTANQWIVPALVNLHPMKVSQMLIKKPHFRARLQNCDRVTKSTASRQLFSTVRSGHDTTPLTLNQSAAALYPDCRNSVALLYSNAAAQANYEPYDDISVAESVDVNGVNELLLMNY